MLPPSPRAVPVLGHLHLLRGILHQALFNLARQYGPYMFLKFGSKPVLVVSSSHAAEQVLKAHDAAFASRPKTVNSEILTFEGSGPAFARHGESWRQTRKLCVSELLTAKRVESFRPARAEEMTNFIHSLLDLSSKGQAIDMTHKLSEYTFNVMCRLLINKSYSKEDSEGAEQATEFRNVIMEGAKLVGAGHIGDFIPWLKWLDFSLPHAWKLHRKIDEFLQRQIDEHRASYQCDNLRDFMDIMLSVNAIDNKKLKATILDLMGAGTETSALTVEWALSELIQNPEVMDKAREEIQVAVGRERMVRETDLPKLGYLHAIIKETFRLHPSTPLLIPHESIEACELNEFTIPTETLLFVNIYAIGRDPSSWKDPLKFDPARFLGNNSKDYRGQDFELIPFGSGRRSCPGMLLATTFVQFLLANLIHGFSWATQSNEKVDMNEGLGLTLTRASHLKLVACPRLESPAYLQYQEMQSTE